MGGNNYNRFGLTQPYQQVTSRHLNFEAQLRQRFAGGRPVFYGNINALRNALMQQGFTSVNVNAHHDPVMGYPVLAASAWSGLTPQQYRDRVMNLARRAGFEITASNVYQLNAADSRY
jgi:hypothetical protein